MDGFLRSNDPEHMETSPVLEQPLADADFGAAVRRSAVATYHARLLMQAALMIWLTSLARCGRSRLDRLCCMRASRTINFDQRLAQDMHGETQSWSVVHFARALNTGDAKGFDVGPERMRKSQPCAFAVNPYTDDIRAGHFSRARGRGNVQWITVPEKSEL